MISSYSILNFSFWNSSAYFEILTLYNNEALSLSFASTSQLNSFSFVSGYDNFPDKLLDIALFVLPLITNFETVLSNSISLLSSLIIDKIYLSNSDWVNNDSSFSISFTFLTILFILIAFKFSVFLYSYSDIELNL